MPKVITKKSTVAGKVPLSSDLDIGELAVNTADKKLYTKHSNNAVVQIGTTITISSTAPASPAVNDLWIQI
jgi:carbonic anhydrase/acetyltransferase-like protein (isoleucine patch superfamily)